MKTAALALGLGLGCAAAGLPGDAAAGQPLEERLERARRLSADACATETTTFSTCLADASITFTPATPAGPWASCADVQAEVAGICAAGPTTRPDAAANRRAGAGANGAQFKGSRSR